MPDMDMEIRRAEAPDLSALTALARRTYVEAYGPDMQEEALAAQLAGPLSPERMAEMFGQDVFFVAGTGGRLAGFVQLGTARPDYRSRDGMVTAEPQDLEVRRLSVRSGHQRQGLGRRLMDAALDQARLSGGRRIFLTVWHANTGAQRFYDRFGFRRIGTVAAPGPDGGVDFLLLRELQPT